MSKILKPKPRRQSKLARSIADSIGRTMGYGNSLDFDNQWGCAKTDLMRPVKRKLVKRKVKKS